MGISGSKIPTRIGIILLPLLFAALARAEAPAAPTAAAETSPSNDECLGCHSNELDRSKGRAIPAIGEAFAGSVHGQINLACVDCHADLQGKDLPHADKLAKPVCSQCHEDAVKAYDQSVHAGSRRKSDNSDAAWCSDCHGVHDIRSSKDPQSKTYHFNLPATCSRCHADEAVIAKAHIEAGNVPTHFQDSIHGRALTKSGLVVAPNCATCHGNHEIRRASDDKSRVNRYNIPKTCGSCHAGILAIYETSVHAKALREGNPRAAVCIDCHTAHDTKVVDAAWKMDLVKECGTCHKESMRTFRDTFHGKVSTLGFSRHYPQPCVFAQDVVAPWRNRQRHRRFKKRRGRDRRWARWHGPGPGPRDQQGGEQAALCRGDCTPSPTHAHARHHGGFNRARRGATRRDRHGGRR